MHPIRIQRSRKEKQTSPNGLKIKYVGRPSKFGNPFKVTGEEGHWFVLDTRFNFLMLTFNDKSAAIDCAIEFFKEYVKDINLSELKGQNLSCWCSLKDKCHADVLLELANKPIS